MCFEVKNLKCKKAKEDIQCLKVIRKDNSPAYRWSHGVTTPYIKNEKMPIVKIKIINSAISTNKSIFEGYHSTKISTGQTNEELKHEVVAMGGSEITLKDIKLAKFIIPKGTRYYENDNQYVSETIIML